MDLLGKGTKAGSCNYVGNVGRMDIIKIRDEIENAAKKVVLVGFQIGPGEQKLLPILRTLSNVETLNTFRTIHRVQTAESNLGKRIHSLRGKLHTTHFSSIEQVGLVHGTPVGLNFRLSQSGDVLANELLPTIDRTWKTRTFKEGDTPINILGLLSNENGLRVFRLFTLRKWTEAEIEPFYADLSEFVKPVLMQFASAGLLIRSQHSAKYALSSKGRAIDQILGSLASILRTEDLRRI